MPLENIVMFVSQNYAGGSTLSLHIAVEGRMLRKSSKIMVKLVCIEVG